MYEFDDDECSEMIEQIEAMSEEELQALEDYENRTYTPEDQEQEEITVDKDEIDAALSKDKLDSYIVRKGEPVNPEGSALEQYENVEVQTRETKNPTVPYVENTVRIDGRNVTGRFPEFESSKEVLLPSDMRFARVSQQEVYCNKELHKDVEANPEKFRGVFSPAQLEQIKGNHTPEGFSWHHHQDLGRMQLVDADQHSANRHDGGFLLWGREKR